VENMGDLFVILLIFFVYAYAEWEEMFND